ncbi:MAG: sulfite reductase, partial [Bacteroidetes bacterium]|nr:sulfite reductase [Bacteroidota bacterium]
QLSRLGGKRIVPIQKCDVDYESEAEHWFDSLLKELNHSTETKTIEKLVVAAVKTPCKTICQGTVLSHINLNDRGSNKETWHIEIAAEALEYEAGDSIGIVPKNREEIADLIIAISKVDPNRIIEYKKESRSI